MMRSMYDTLYFKALLMLMVIPGVCVLVDCFV